MLRKTCSNRHVCDVRFLKQKGRVRTVFMAHNYRREKAQVYRACIAAQKFVKTPERRFKSLNYGFYTRQLEKAQARKFHEALLFNRKGHCVEGCTTNVFFVKRKVLYTPSLQTGCLDGIMRHNVINAAIRLGICVRRGFFSLENLERSDEAFVTNSLIRVVPLISLGTKPIGNRQVGPLTTQINNCGFSLLRVIIIAIIIIL